MSSFKEWMPEGESLDEESFQVRHRLIMRVVWAHAPALFVFGLVRHFSVAHTLLDLAPLVSFAAIATFTSSRVTRTMLASAALLSASGVLIHFTGGLIEAHIHVYVALVLVALYIDWRPYAAAIVAVLVHHVGIGLVAPETVFAHAAGRNNPFLWALIHAAFVIAESLIFAVLWKVTTEQHDRLTIALTDASDAALARERYESLQHLERLQHAEEIELQLAQKARIQHEIETQSQHLDQVGEQLHHSMRVVASGIDEMSASVGEIASNARQAASVATAAAREAAVSKLTVANLAEVSAQIGGLVETIGGVAAQTNLLALNASIEAARAGEAGRGFAVVANEVKELAGQASVVADQVAVLVRSIQERTGEVVNHLEQITTVIDDIDRLQTGIAVATDQQADSTRSIAGNAATAADGATLIVDSLHRLTALSRS